MSQFYKLRTDLKQSSVDSIVKYISSISVRFSYVIEGTLTDNPHIHFYLETTSKNPAIRAQIRKLCGTGNGSYSLKATEENPIEYLAYMLKEGKVTYSNMSQEVINKSQIHNAEVKASIANKKKLRLPVWKQISQIIQKENKTISYLSILQYVVAYHTDRDLVLRRNNIKAYADTIALHLNPYMIPLFLHEILDNNPLSKTDFEINLKK